jgi:hypothetical protein
VYNTPIVQGKAWQNFTADFMMLKRFIAGGDYEALNQISETKRTADGQNMGFNGRKSRVWICFLYTICSNSNGKSLVSVGASDSILMTVVILGNNWLLIRICLQFGFDNQQLLVKNKMIRINFSKILFHNKMHGIGRR